jgi:hypothetical protein
VLHELISWKLARPRGQPSLNARSVPPSTALPASARQKSKLAGTIRGSFFVIKGEY